MSKISHSNSLSTKSFCSSMLRVTVQCGEDSATFPLYINGQWVTNLSLSFIPELYNYQITDTGQASWFTTDIK